MIDALEGLPLALVPADLGELKEAKELLTRAYQAWQSLIELLCLRPPGGLFIDVPNSNSARRTNGKNPGGAEFSARARTRYDGLATLNFFHFPVF